jgi:hypothetical protein
METNTITRQEIFIRELATWLCRSDEIMLSHHSKEYDFLVQTKENDPSPSLFNFPLPDEKKIPSTKPVKYENSKVLIFKFLPAATLKQKELDHAQMQQHGWYHHQLLQKTLYWTEEMFVPFLNYIIGMRKESIPNMEKQSQVVRFLLATLIKQIDTLIIKGGTLVPDLYTFRGDTNLMSYQEQLVSDWIGKDRSGFRYKYLFSFNTSRAFTESLLDMLRRKLDDQNFIQSLDAYVPDQIKSTEPVSHLPKDVLVRIAFLEDYYGLNSVTETHNKDYSRAQLMFLFKILEQSKIIHDDLPKEQLALAISILTGISVTQVYKLYPHKSKMDREKLFKSEYVETIIEQIRIISEDAISAISKGQKNYSFK